jgi:hypothetical protein
VVSAALSACPPGSGLSVLSDVPAALADRAARIRAALARRDEADAVIARELRAARETLGSTRAWLAWVESEFGWARSTAFRRLDVDQVALHRAVEAARHRVKPVEPVAAVPVAEVAEVAAEVAGLQLETAPTITATARTAPKPPTLAAVREAARGIVEFGFAAIEADCAEDLDVMAAVHEARRLLVERINVGAAA